MERRGWIVVATILASGCSDVSGTAPEVADASQSDAAPFVDAAWGNTAFDVHVVDVIRTTAIAGASVCLDPSNCEITDANGDVTVTVAGPPNDLQLAFAAAAAGHLSIVGLGRVYRQLDVSIYTVPSTLGLLADADAADLLTSAGFEYPATSTGFIRATVFDGVTTGVEQGATVTLDGSTNAPVYLDADGRPDTSMTAIGSGGGVMFGDVPAGPFSLTVHVPNKVCTMQSYAWDGSGNESPSATGVVVAGALTDGITLACYDSN